MSRAYIIRVDGGICSQIAFVALGLLLKERFGERTVVKYDLSWYDEWGRDVDGRVVRTWDFQKAFPGIPLVIADKQEARELAAVRSCSDLGELGDGPAYICGYPPERDAAVVRFRSRFAEAFHPVTPNSLGMIFEQLSRGGCCGIHVRRGDLSVQDPAHGIPTSVDYYIRAISLVRAFVPDVRYFFFSDEMEWVRQNLIQRLPDWCQYELVDQNGSDRGYLGLYLLAQCEFIISSVGSMGCFAAALSAKCKGLVLSRYRPEIMDGLDNCIYLNDDRPSFVPPREPSSGTMRPAACKCQKSRLMEKIRRTMEAPFVVLTERWIDRYGLKLVWGLALVATAVYGWLLVRYFPWYSTDTLDRYAPMAEYFAVGDFRAAFHPKFGLVFQVLTGALVWAAGCSGLVACQLIATTGWCLSIVPLWSASRRLFGDTAAWCAVALFMVMPEYLEYAGCGVRDGLRILSVALMFLGFISSSAWFALGLVVSLTLRVDAIGVGVMLWGCHFLLMVLRRNWRSLVLPALALILGLLADSSLVFVYTGWFVPDARFIRFLGGAL